MRKALRLSTASTFSTAVLLALFVAAHSARAADKSNPKSKVTVMGKVSVEKDGDTFKSVKLTTTEGVVYQLTLDDKGNEVGKMYEGISVQVSGTESTKDKDKWLTVTLIGEKKKKGK
ncbi:MAG TPA: hypothetical protein VKX17_18855 [Planctomycetota bacterium]|nr:hypothetical protein [Planctomycetota bacterium]